MRLCLAVLVGLLLHEAAWAGEAPGKEYENLAARVQVLTVDNLLHRRPGFFAPPFGDSPKTEAEFVALADRTSLAEFEELLKHADPKVRTLALAGLFRSENLKALPLIMRLVGDDAETFSAEGLLSQGVKLPPPPPVLVKQTVQEVALALVDFYLSRANIGSHTWAWAPGQEITDEGVENYRRAFADYWEKRKDRAACASWFEVRLAAASQPIPPSSSECRGDVHSIRKEIDALPGTDGPLTLLWLQHLSRENVNRLLTREELVRALQKVDRAQLRRVLKGEKFSDDPDLDPSGKNSGQAAMVSILLKHAGEIFKAEDAPAFLEMGQETSDARYWIAAADMKPEEALASVQAGIAFFKAKSRAPFSEELMARLWEAGGPEEKKAAVDWYFEAILERQNIWSFYFSTTKTPTARQLMAQLLEDSRAETLMSSQTLSGMAEQVNEWSRQEIIPGSDIQVMEGGWGGKGKFAPPTVPHHVRGVLERLRASIPEWREI